MKIKNTFLENKKCEYLEKFDIEGRQLKDYIKRKESSKNLFAKVYIKTLDNENFIDILFKNQFSSFTYSKSKKLIIGVLSSDNMALLKDNVSKVWDIYRNTLEKEKFNMGKQ